MTLLVLVHVLFLGHIHIYGIATPLIYIMLPIHFSTAQPRWSALMWCFVTGLLIDVFMNTPGMTSGALTVIGLLQPRVLRLLVQNDDDEEIVPSLKTMGWIKFLLYILILTRKHPRDCNHHHRCRADKGVRHRTAVLRLNVCGTHRPPAVSLRHRHSGARKRQGRKGGGTESQTEHLRHEERDCRKSKP